MGLEPTIFRATIWRLSQLGHIHHISELVRQEGLEPPTYCLEGSCSIQLSYWRISNGAGDGNRTRVSSLEGWCSTIELHPRKPLPERFSFDILTWFSRFVKTFFSVSSAFRYIAYFPESDGKNLPVCHERAMLFLFFRFVPAYKRFFCLFELCPFQMLPAAAAISLIFIFHWRITPWTYGKCIFILVNSNFCNAHWHSIFYRCIHGS